MWEALEHFEKSLELKEKIKGYNHIECIYSLNNIGLVFLKIGNIDESLTFYRRALKIAKDRLGTEHRLYATIEDNIDVAMVNK